MDRVMVMAMEVEAEEAEVSKFLTSLTLPHCGYGPRRHTMPVFYFL
jgi:hypothetical protein